MTTPQAGAVHSAASNLNKPGVRLEEVAAETGGQEHATNGKSGSHKPFANPEEDDASILARTAQWFVEPITPLKVVKGAVASGLVYGGYKLARAGIRKVFGKKPEAEQLAAQPVPGPAPMQQ